MRTSTLELQWRIRSGGGSRTERRYLDFVVNGVSLQDQLNAADQVTNLGCWSPESERAYIEQLLLQGPAESLTGRVPIYVCGECGDLGCGAVTAVIERAPDGFAWRGFAFENNYDAEMTDLASYREVGPFLFNKTEYWQLLQGRAPVLSTA